MTFLTKPEGVVIAFIAMVCVIVTVALVTLSVQYEPKSVRALHAGVVVVIKDNVATVHCEHGWWQREVPETLPLRQGHRILIQGHDFNEALIVGDCGSVDDIKPST